MTNEDHTATPPDLADKVARSSGKTEAGETRLPRPRVELREYSTQDQAEHARKVVAAYIEQATRNMLEIGRGFESLGHAFGELAITLTRRPS